MAHATAHPEGLDVAFGITQPATLERRPHRYSDSALSFEQWMRRPVYVVQCKTWTVAKALGVCCVRFRALPGHRDDEAKHARGIVAMMLRRQRQRVPL